MVALDVMWQTGCEARVRHALTAEMFETFPSGGSMHASVKLEGIDGRAPQDAWSMWLNSTQRGKSYRVRTC